jgi:5-carboxymethyl-2-hydroxymuconate isomerase
MPHLRLEVPEEWLREDFRAATGFDAKKLLDHLVQVVSGLRMDNPAIEMRLAEGAADAGELPKQVPFINLTNLKHAIVPLYYAHVAGDKGKRFLHATLSAGNDTPGRSATVRRRVAETLGNEIDAFTAGVQGLASVTAHVQDIDRDRGYSTTAERRKKREQTAETPAKTQYSSLNKHL